jgi:hypothetical protein
MVILQYTNGATILWCIYLCSKLHLRHIHFILKCVKFINTWSYCSVSLNKYHSQGVYCYNSRKVYIRITTVYLFVTEIKFYATYQTLAIQSVIHQITSTTNTCRAGSWTAYEGIHSQVYHWKCWMKLTINFWLHLMTLGQDTPFQSREEIRKLWELQITELIEYEELGSTHWQDSKTYLAKGKRSLVRTLKQWKDSGF